MCDQEPPSFFLCKQDICDFLTEEGLNPETEQFKFESSLLPAMAKAKLDGENSGWEIKMFLDLAKGNQIIQKKEAFIFSNILQQTRHEIKMFLD